MVGVVLINAMGGRKSVVGLRGLSRTHENGFVRSRRVIVVRLKVLWTIRLRRVTLLYLDRRANVRQAA